MKPHGVSDRDLLIRDVIKGNVANVQRTLIQSKSLSQQDLISACNEAILNDQFFIYELLKTRLFSLADKVGTLLALLSKKRFDLVEEILSLAQPTAINKLGWQKDETVATLIAAFLKTIRYGDINLLNSFLKKIGYLIKIDHWGEGLQIAVAEHSSVSLMTILLTLKNIQAINLKEEACREQVYHFILKALLNVAKQRKIVLFQIFKEKVPEFVEKDLELVKFIAQRCTPLEEPSPTAKQITTTIHELSLSPSSPSTRAELNKKSTPLVLSADEKVARILHILKTNEKTTLSEIFLLTEDAVIHKLDDIKKNQLHYFILSNFFATTGKKSAENKNILNQFLLEHPCYFLSLAAWETILKTAVEQSIIPMSKLKRMGEKNPSLKMIKILLNGVVDLNENQKKFVHGVVQKILLAATAKTNKKIIKVVAKNATHILTPEDYRITMGAVLLNNAYGEDSTTKKILRKIVKQISEKSNNMTTSTAIPGAMRKPIVNAYNARKEQPGENTPNSITARNNFCLNKFKRFV